MKVDDVLLNKSNIIDRCLVRIKEEYDGIESLRSNLAKQDSVILNLQRACEASIDMANRVIRIKQFAIVQSARDAFDVLQKQFIISPDLSQKMQNMVGLRNIAVHDYQALNLEIVASIVEKHLVDFEEFRRELLKIEL